MTRLPATVPIPGLPTRVQITEMGARDGLQNEKLPIATDIKLEFISRLAAAGLGEIEATSFVHPRWVPQLADSDVLFAQLPVGPPVRYSALVPNLGGLERALKVGVQRIAVFGSATETFAQKNLGRGYEEQFQMFAPVVTQALANGMTVRAYLSMCFGDPWEGPVPIDRVVTAGRRMLELGCDELSIGDTIGVGTPGHVTALLTAFVAAGVPLDRLGVHFHDTYGQALANTLAALWVGITKIDASAGGLGGCPYAKSATGNLATEDLIWMLDGLGIHHGVDLDLLVRTSVWMAQKLSRPSPSAVVRALGGTPGGEATSVNHH